MNFELQESLEKQGSELKQAKQVIPNLQRQFTSLTGQLQCLAVDFAEASFSSPTQEAITDDLSLSLAKYSMFGSLFTFGAMIGAITIGPIADFIGRKGAMRVSTAFCVTGWLAIYFAECSPGYDMIVLRVEY